MQRMSGFRLGEIHIRTVGKLRPIWIKSGQLMTSPLWTGQLPIPDVVSDKYTQIMRLPETENMSQQGFLP